MFGEIMQVAQRIRRGHLGFMSGGRRVGAHSIEALGLPAWDRTQRLVAQLRNFSDIEFRSRRTARAVGVASVRTAMWTGVPIVN